MHLFLTPFDFNCCGTTDHRAFMTFDFTFISIFITIIIIKPSKTFVFTIFITTTTIILHIIMGTSLACAVCTIFDQHLVSLQLKSQTFVLLQEHTYRPQSTANTQNLSCYHCHLDANICFDTLPASQTFRQKNSTEICMVTTVTQINKTGVPLISHSGFHKFPGSGKEQHYVNKFYVLLSLRSVEIYWVCFQIADKHMAIGEIPSLKRVFITSNSQHLSFLIHCISVAFRVLF